MDVPDLTTGPGSSMEPKPNEAPRVLLTVEAAAEQLSIGRTYMYQLLKNGQIESVKVGRLRRIPAVALTAYARRLATEQNDAA